MDSLNTEGTSKVKVKMDRSTETTQLADLPGQTRMLFADQTRKVSITPTPFKLVGASNYPAWKLSARICLEEIPNAFECVSGALQPPVYVDPTKPTDDEKKAQAKYDEANKMVRAFFIRSIDIEVLMAEYANTQVETIDAHEIWDKLENKFQRITNMKKDLMYSEFLRFHINSQESMKENLDRYDLIIRNMSTLKISVDADLTISKLVQSLPEDWDIFKQTWSAQSGPRYYTTLKDLILAEEARRHLANSQVNNIAALLAKTNVNKGNKVGYKKGKPGQFKGGFKGGKPKTKGKGNCFNCQSPNHWARDCKLKIKDASLSSHSEGTGRPHDAFVVEALMSERDNDDLSFILDSGSTNHIANQLDFFSEYEQFKEPLVVKCGNSSSMLALGKGQIEFQSFVNQKWRDCKMTEVLYVPDTRRNLFSIAMATDNGMLVAGNKTRIHLIKDNIIRAVAVRSGNLFKLLMRIPDRPEANVALTNSLQDWHEKLGHLNKVAVKKLLKAMHIEFDNSNDSTCESCILGKQHKATYKAKTTKVTEIGEINSDLCGPFRTTSIGGSNYFMCLTDTFSKYRKVYFLKNKSEAAQYIVDYLQWFKNQTGKSVKSLLTDGGLEFNNQTVKNALKEIGANFRMSNPYCPAQNGIAERTNRTIVELARAMLISSKLPKSLWAEAVNCAVYILNKTHSNGESEKIPEQIMFGKKPAYNHLKSFGDKCFILDTDQREKWDPKSKPAVLVGYSEDVDGYRVYIPTTSQIKRSKNVVFPSNDESNNNLSQQDEIWVDDDGMDMSDTDDKEVEVPTPIKTPHKDVPHGHHLRDRSKVKKPVLYTAMAESLLTEPQSYKEAMASSEASKWQVAMDKEMNSLYKQEVWELVPLPKGAKAISTRWVFRVKLDEHGNVDKYKARLVVKGFSQREGIDFNQTFSPVVRYDTLRIIISLAAAYNLELKQIDVASAFLYGNLDEEIFAKQPDGYQDGSTQVCHLKKSLYGLRQSPRCWHKKLHTVLNSFGLQQSKADNCLYFSNQKGCRLLLCIYVDDGLIAAEQKETLNALIDALENEFEITKKELSYFLSIHIKKLESGSIAINQSKYIGAILERFGMQDAKSVSTPMENNQSKTEKKIESDFPYRESIGALMYLTNSTRPDLAYAVHYLARFLESPQPIHWVQVKRILKYLAGTKDLGIVYDGNTLNNQLISYSDADYAFDPETRRSVSGTLFMYNGGAIAWSSTRQKSVALSSMESELIAATEGTKHLLWTCRLLEEIGEPQIKPTLYVDNLATIKVVQNPELYKRSKHIEVREFFIREKFNEGKLDVQHVSTTDQLADICTKALPKSTFQRLRSAIGMQSITSSIMTLLYMMLLMFCVVGAKPWDDPYFQPNDCNFPANCSIGYQGCVIWHSTADIFKDCYNDQNICLNQVDEWKVCIMTNGKITGGEQLWPIYKNWRKQQENKTTTTKSPTTTVKPNINPSAYISSILEIAPVVLIIIIILMYKIVSRKNRGRIIEHRETEMENLLHNNL